MGLGNFFRDLVLGVKRSNSWPRVQSAHLKEYPVCECCGCREGLEVHHKNLVWLFPDLELEPGDLITLCEKRGCHLAMGHLYSYRSYNPDIDADIVIWNKKVKDRPVINNIVAIIILVATILFTCEISRADIFGPHDKDAIGSSLESNSLLDGVSKIIEYLGARVGVVYDFSQKEWCFQTGATLYTYNDWGLAFDISALNIDGGAITADWNIGKMIPCEGVPILEYLKYLYIGGGIGTRHIDDEWKMAPIASAQLKFTF